jgi:predicted dehydrogenase
VIHQRPGSREGHVIKEGAVELMTAEHPEGTVIDPPSLEPGARNAIEHFAACLTTGRPLDELVTPAAGRDVQEILDAGYRALARESSVTLRA